ncbi:MAG: signal recognition particle-docking protein FtsY [Sphaerochaetaceae bacterium]|jgi:fused signal recognition particle receptor|nr:signal recognition particle-docking protein FtsY [Sphaerochaetaceae bacterium]MDC7237102.1 signal recognition particle-docking protein FtsY [Sphaerochaetaceae bacterium]MDC7248700.1 signal recognition particle-docking protein FtsY [Sphaerochaetaceae bacterium]
MFEKFGAKLKALFGTKKLDESFYEDLEDLLVEGDLGASMAMDISDKLRARAKEEKCDTQEDLQRILKEILKDKVKPYNLPVKKDELTIVLVLGVNGVGKTTSIAKIANKYKKEGNNVLLAAADTFRAAAIDQLELHANRLGVRIVKQNNGSDPGAVIFDAITSAKAKNDNLILADTAGRMHNKDNLLRELKKIDKVIRAKGIDDAHYKKVLVIDSTTGQNGFSQAQLFNDAIKLDALILSKYDSAAKGGSLVQIGEKLNLPVAFVGVGESYSDIKEFDEEEFLNSLVGLN